MAYTPSDPRNDAESHDSNVDKYEGNSSEQQSATIGDYMIGSGELVKVYSHISNDDEENQSDDNVNPPELTKFNTTGTYLDPPPSPSQRHGIFSKENRPQLRKVLFSFVRNYLIMIFFIFGIFSIYWGSMYRRNERVKNLPYLVVNGDNTTTNVEPLIGDTLVSIIQTPDMQARGKWRIYPESEFASEAQEKNMTVKSYMEYLVHRRKYWASAYIQPNATQDLYSAMSVADASYPYLNIVEVEYESARDAVTVNSYVLPAVKELQNIYNDIQGKRVYEPLLDRLNSSQKVAIIENAPSLLYSVSSFSYNDRLAQLDPVLMAPLQVGLIFVIIITFFQFNFFATTHLIIAQTVKIKHYVLYRIISAQISYLLLSLAYSSVSGFFQVDFTKAYGRGGFVVYWMITYLEMAAVGGINEIMALIIFPVYPPVLGFWLLFWVISNISPAFSPIELCPEFFRYGYGYPLFNAAEASRVVLLNTWKGHMGRNVGVLVAWIVLANSPIPFALKFSGGIMGKKKMAEIAAQRAHTEAAVKKALEKYAARHPTTKEAHVQHSSQNNDESS